MDRRNPESIVFERFRRDVTSQNGEDGVVARVFELIGATNRVCIEFGAADGRKFSNSWALINDKGWSGILIEGRESSFRELRATYAGNPLVQAINRYVGFGADSLDNILAEAQCPAEPDLLSIDIDGLDWHVWESLRNYRPRLVLIEFNPTIPNDVLFVPDRTGNQGCSLRALVALGQEKGYELAATTDWNAFFVPRELFAKLGIVDNSIDAIHSASKYETKLFQLYDTTPVIVGNERLLWSDGRIAGRIVRSPCQRWKRLAKRIKGAMRRLGLMPASRGGP